jgi:tRNA 2-thiouridine synthesizing protein A
MGIKVEKREDGTFTLDCQGFVCPHPQIYTKKVLDQMSSGSVLEVVFDNPSSSESITSMCRSAGHEIFQNHLEEGKYTFRIRKK